MANDNQSLSLKIKADVDDARTKLNALLKDIKNMDSGVGGAVKTFNAASVALRSLGLVAAATSLAAAFSSVIRAAAEAEAIEGRLAAVLRATGEASGLSAKELGAMADQLARVTQFDDGQIKEAMTVLLAFPRVGRQNFGEAIRLAADLAVVMGTDLASAARNVGRALQDPVGGLRVLKTELGVNTDALGAQNQKLVEAGNLFDAQQNVIKELEGRLGGAAAGANTGLAGATKGVTKAWDDMLKTLGRTPEIKGGATQTLNGITYLLNSIEGAIQERNQNFLARYGLTPPERLTPNQPIGRIDIPGVKPHISTDEEVAAAQARARRLAEVNLSEQQKLIKDELDRSRAALDRELAQNLIGYRDYYARRAALQKSAIDQQIAATEQALAGQRAALANDANLSAGDRLTILAKTKDLETQLILLRRQRADVDVQASAEEVQAGVKQLDALDQVRERLATAQGEAASARRSALEREFRDLVAKLEAQGDRAGIALIEKLINTEVAKTRLDEFQQIYDRALQQMQATEADIAAKRDAGLIGEIQARREVIALHKATNQQLAAIIPQMQALAETTGPEAQQRVRELAAAWQQLGREIDPVASQINTALEQDLAGGLEGFINQTKTAAQAFSAFAKSVMADLARIAAQKLAEQLFQGFNLASAGNAIASLFHGGGVVGAGGAARAVPAAAFLGAPRYHGGGIAGLAPDEVPAILKRGETVLTPAQARAGGTPGAVKVQIDNKGTPQQASDAQVTFDPAGMVIKVITDDVRRGGPASNALARAFNLRRGGGG